MTQVDRTKFIGSSEVAGVLGLSRWTTPLKIWSIKTGAIEAEDISGKEFVEWGTRLENVVAEKFAEKNNVKLMAYKKRYVHKKYPFLQMELDRLIVGTDEIVEVKTCTEWKAKEWDENIPQEYILQVMFALCLSGRKIGHLAVLIGGNKYREKTILFDEELYNDMIKKCVYFWEEHVLKNVPPMAVGDDNTFMVDLYPENKTEDLKVANEEVESWIAHLQETKMHIKEMKKEADEMESKIKQVIGETAGLKTEKYVVTWKTQNGAPKYLKAQMINDGVFEEYTEETTRRVMRVKLNKED